MPEQPDYLDPQSTPQAQQPPKQNDQVSLEDFEEMARQKYGVPKNLVQAMTQQESGGSWDRTSPTGVKGKYQVTEATARQYGLDRNDPFQQTVAAMKHLRAQYDALGDIKDNNARWLSAVGRYYGGSNAVDAQGRISTDSPDGVSNPLTHMKRVADNWKQLGLDGNGDGIPDSQQTAQTPVPQQKQVKPQARQATPPAPTPSLVQQVVGPNASKSLISNVIAQDQAQTKQMSQPINIGANPKQQVYDVQSPQQIRQQYQDFQKQQALESAAQPRRRKPATPTTQNTARSVVGNFGQGVVEGALNAPKGIVAQAASGLNSLAQGQINTPEGKILAANAQGMVPAYEEAAAPIQEAANSYLPVNPQDQSLLTSKLPRMAGGIVPLIATTALTRGKGTAGALSLEGAYGMGLQNAAGAYDDAIANGASEEDALKAAQQGFASGATTGSVGLGATAAKIGIQRPLSERALEVAHAIGQNVAQTVANNATAQNVGYDPNRSLLQGTGEAALTGGLLSAGMHALNPRSFGARVPEQDTAPVDRQPVGYRNGTEIVPIDVAEAAARDTALRNARQPQEQVAPTATTPDKSQAQPAAPAAQGGAFSQRLAARKSKLAQAVAPVQESAPSTPAEQPANVNTAPEAAPSAPVENRSKVEILDPNQPIDEPAGTRLRRLTIDGNEVIVRTPKGMSKEAAQIIAEQQVRKGAQGGQTSPEPIQSEARTPEAAPAPETNAQLTQTTEQPPIRPAEPPVEPNRGNLAESQAVPNETERVGTPAKIDVQDASRRLQRAAQTVDDSVFFGDEGHVYHSPLRPPDNVMGRNLGIEKVYPEGNGRYFKTSRPLTADEIRQYDLIPASYDAKEAVHQQIADSLTGPVAALRNGDKFALIHPSSKEEGGYQLTYGDGKGFAGDDQYKTFKEASLAALRDGYTSPMSEQQANKQLEKALASKPEPTTKVPKVANASEQSGTLAETPPANSEIRTAAPVEAGAKNGAPVSPAEEAPTNVSRDSNVPATEAGQARPSDVYSRHGIELAPEVADAIDKRHAARESEDKGNLGKLGEFSRKALFRTGEENPDAAFAAHPVLRKLLGLPEIPQDLYERSPKDWASMAQHTMDALAHEVGAPRSSRIDEATLNKVGELLGSRLNPRNPEHRNLVDVYGQTRAAVDIAHGRVDDLFADNRVRSAIEAAQAHVDSGKALRGQVRTELKNALIDAQDRINKSQPGIQGQSQADVTELTNHAISEFITDLSTGRLGGDPKGWLAKQFRDNYAKSDTGAAREPVRPAGVGSPRATEAGETRPASRSRRTPVAERSEPTESGSRNAAETGAADRGNNAERTGQERGVASEKQGADRSADNQERQDNVVEKPVNNGNIANMDVSEITRERLPEVFASVKSEIGKNDPKLSPNRAGELAAARIRNAFHDKIADIDDRARLGDITDQEEQWYDSIHVDKWSPTRDLEELSGSRSIASDIDEPIAKKPLSERLPDNTTSKLTQQAENAAKAESIAERIKAGRDERKAKQEALREENARVNDEMRARINNANAHNSPESEPGPPVKVDFGKPRTEQGIKKIEVKRSFVPEGGNKYDRDNFWREGQVTIRQSNRTSKEYYVESPSGQRLTADAPLKTAKLAAEKILGLAKVDEDNGAIYAKANNGQAIVLSKTYGDLAGGTAAEVAKRIESSPNFTLGKQKGKPEDNASADSTRENGPAPRSRRTPVAERSEPTESGSRNASVTTGATDRGNNAERTGQERGVASEKQSADRGTDNQERQDNVMRDTIVNPLDDEAFYEQQRKNQQKANESISPSDETDAERAERIRTAPQGTRISWADMQKDAEYRQRLFETDREKSRIEREAAKSAKQSSGSTDIDDFVKDVPALRAAKMKAALDLQMGFNGEYTTRARAIEQRVEEGWRVAPESGSVKGRRFISPDGRFLAERDLTKTGVDYAQHLVDRMDRSNKDNNLTDVPETDFGKKRDSMPNPLDDEAFYEQQRKNQQKAGQKNADEAKPANDQAAHYADYLGEQFPYLTSKERADIANERAKVLEGAQDKIRTAAIEEKAINKARELNDSRDPDLHRERTENLTSLDDVSVKPSLGWQGSMSSEQGDLIADGHTIVRRDAVRNKALFDKPGTYVDNAEKAISQTWDKATSNLEGKSDADVVGVKDYDKQERKDGGIPTAYLLERGGDRVISVNSDKLALLKKQTNFDGIKVKDAKSPVVLTKNGEPVAVVMPLRDENPQINVTAARERISGEPTPRGGITFGKQKGEPESGGTTLGSNLGNAFDKFNRADIGKILDHLKTHGENFVGWAKAMIKDFGEQIRPYLQKIWGGLKDFHADQRGSLSADLTPLPKQEKNIKKAQKNIDEKIGVPTDFDIEKYARTADKLIEGSKISDEKKAKAVEIFDRIVQAHADNDGVVLSKAQIELKDTLRGSKWAVADFMRPLNATGEFSPVGRQGWIGWITHPVVSKDAFLAATGKEEGAMRFLAKMQADPDMPLMKDAGLDLGMLNETNLSRHALAREENTTSRWPEKIPVVGHVLGGIERFNKTFLEGQRVGLFKAYKAAAEARGAEMWTTNEKGDVVPSKAAEQIAKQVNILTGRGDLPNNQVVQAIADLGSMVAYSPRFTISRFQAADPTRLYRVYKQSPEVFKSVATDYVKQAGAYLALGGALAAAGYKVALDPDDPDFLKVVIGGIHVPIPQGGMQPAIRFTAKMMKRGYEMASAAANRDSDKMGQAAGTAAKNIGSFLRQKEAPMAGLVHDQLFDRKDVMDASTQQKVNIGTSAIGQPVSAGRDFAQRFLPMYYQQIVETYQNAGPAKAAASGAGELFGLTSGYYDTGRYGENIADGKGKARLKRDWSYTQSGYAPWNEGLEPMDRYKGRVQRADALYNEALPQLRDSSAYQEATEANKQKMEETLTRRIQDLSYDEEPNRSKISPSAIISSLRAGEKRSESTRKKSLRKAF